MKSFQVLVLVIAITLCEAYKSSRQLYMSKYLGKNPVFVAGGSSGVGLEVVKQLSAMGTPVKALVRRQEAVESLASMPGVTSIYGDAANEADVQAAMSGCVAAISTLGGRAGADGERIDYVGNSNVIEQAGILGVERIILVTSIGCGPTVKALSPEVYRVLEEAIVLKNKAERDLRMYTNLDWTIIRPGGLNSDAPTGKAIFTEDPLVSGMITRADVASLVIKALGATSSCTRKELSAVDPSISNLSSVKPYVV